MAKETNVIRKNFDFTEDDFSVMRKLKSGFKAVSISEAIRRSIRLSATLLKLQRAGGKLSVEKKDGSKETIIIVS